MLLTSLLKFLLTELQHSVPHSSCASTQTLYWLWQLKFNKEAEFKRDCSAKHKYGVVDAQSISSCIWMSISAWDADAMSAASHQFSCAGQSAHILSHSGCYSSVFELFSGVKHWLCRARTASEDVLTDDRWGEHTLNSRRYLFLCTSNWNRRRRRERKSWSQSQCAIFNQNDHLLFHTQQDDERIHADLLQSTGWADSRAVHEEFHQWLRWQVSSAAGISWSHEQVKMMSWRLAAEMGPCLRGKEKARCTKSRKSGWGKCWDRKTRRDNQTEIELKIMRACRSNPFWTTDSIWFNLIQSHLFFFNSDTERRQRRSMISIYWYINVSIFVYKMLSYLMMNDQQLDQDPTIDKLNSKQFIKIVQNGQTEHLILTEPLQKQAVVVSHASTCWRAFQEGRRHLWSSRTWGSMWNDWRRMSSSKKQ